MTWTEHDMPDQSGRTVVITGANSGVGFETARVFARHDADVVLACRNLRKADQAITQIRMEIPGASVRPLEIDLASQASVRRAADQVNHDYPHVDLLINNAGAVVRRHEVTEDGFEKTLATNHLGPFAFTGLILGRLLDTPGSRVVTVSSNGHKRGMINFDDLQFRNGFRGGVGHWAGQDAYFQSKLANLLFSFELQRRLAAAGAATIAVAAHPGNARTSFGSDQLPIRTITSRPLRPFTSWLLQDAMPAALPSIRAAVDPTATGGDYYGPDGRNEWTGHPTRVQSAPQSHDAASQRHLWELSGELTGISYPLVVPADEPTPGRAGRHPGR